MQSQKKNLVANWRRGIILFGVLALGLSLGAQPALAQTCIQDQWQNAGNKQKLTCTANDVRIAQAGNVRDLNGNPLDTCVFGQTFSFIADFTVLLGAQERFDIGLYFATDGDEGGTGDGAITGQCSANIITPLAGSPVPLGSANFIQLDPSPDACGDINDANNPQVVTVQVNNVLCQDSDEDGFLNLPNCTSWRQDGANELCQTPTDAFPGSPSKCNCDPEFNIPVFVETGTIDVTKNAAPVSLPEPGGEFTFTVHVQNTSQFTDIVINRICDSDHGQIANVSAESCPAGSLGTINSTTCFDLLPLTLAPDDGMAGGTDEFTCTFTANVNSDTPVPNEQDTVTVFGVDQSPNANPVQDSDSASVAVTDVPPAAMVTKAFDTLNCVNVTYVVDVQNTSTAEPLTLTALTDSSFGNLTDIHDDVTGTTCGVDLALGTQQGAGAGEFPVTVAIGATYSCKFDANFCGAQHRNKATATLSDNDGNSEHFESDFVDVTVTVSTTPQ
jgi:hypothetical protein